MSLLIDARTNKLKKNQLMDLETLDYLCENNPFQDSSFRVKDERLIQESLKAISPFIPNTNWYSNESRLDCIHGLRHAVRVAIYSAILYLSDISTFDFEINDLIIAAMLHDIRRISDKSDRGHAHRTQKWFKNNITNIESFYRVKLSNRSINNIQIAIALHEYSRSDLVCDPRYENNCNIVEVLRTADALDRYIQPRKEWWLKDSFLQYKPGEALKSFAFNLILQSEKARINGSDSLNSVISSLS